MARPSTGTATQVLDGPLLDDLRRILFGGAPASAAAGGGGGSWGQKRLKTNDKLKMRLQRAAAMRGGESMT